VGSEAKCEPARRHQGLLPRAPTLLVAQTVEEQIVAASILQQVSNLSKFTIRNRCGISALAQANSAQQSILGLLR
jgi:flagellin-like hook-associated protein FlgL